MNRPSDGADDGQDNLASAHHLQEITMRFYKVLCTNLVMFKPTRAAAHRYAKTLHDRFNVEVQEIEVPNDRNTVFQLMVNDPAEMDLKVLKRYELTNRGALQEVKE